VFVFVVSNAIQKLCNISAFSAACSLAVDYI